MATSIPPTHEDEIGEPVLLDPSETAEEIIDDGDDQHMGSDSDGDEVAEVTLVNDSKAYFDKHNDSIFSIAAHPSNPNVFLTGGGDDVAYVWNSNPEVSGDEANIIPREARIIAKLSGHTDSVSAAAFLSARWAVTGGLDGKIQLWESSRADGLGKWEVRDSAQEVEEVVWIQAAPNTEAFALGANDGSVWVYSVNERKLEIKHALYSHTASCTAGAFTKDRNVLCTVSEDGSFYAWDLSIGRSIVGLTAEDQRFAIEGGLYSIAVSPSGSAAVMGGATGEMKVIGLPQSGSQRRGAGRSEPGGGGSSGGDQGGKVLASLHTHSESVESLAFHPSHPLLASGGVDGKIVIYDFARGCTVRRTLEGHEEAVVKVEFVDMGSSPTAPWLLTSCGVDGTVRRWDIRAGTQVGVWRGHLGGNQSEGEGGVLGFVQNKDRIVTAGDDHVALVFEVGDQLGGGLAQGVGIQLR